MFDIIYDESAEYRFGEFFEQLNDHHFFNTSKFLISKSGKPELIGSGGSSLVFRGITIDEKIKKNVAIKVIFADNVNDNVRASEEAEKQHEISTYYKDGIIPILETKSIAINFFESICPIYNNEDNNLDRFHFIIMDEMKPIVKSYEADSKKYVLDRVLVENKEEQILKMARNVLVALSICHSKEEPVYHRDIKPENIFYIDELSSYKVGDFGISASGEDLFDAGTKLFMAPEVIGKPENYTAKSDVYSLGYTLLTLLNDGRLVDINRDEDRINEIIANIDGRITNLFLKMCITDAISRPNCDEAIKEIEEITRDLQFIHMNRKDRMKMFIDFQRSEQADIGKIRGSCENRELYKIVFKSNFLLEKEEIEELLEKKGKNKDSLFEKACYYDFISLDNNHRLRAEELYLKAAELGNSNARVFYANSVIKNGKKRQKNNAICQLLQAIIEKNSWGYIVLGDAMRFNDIMRTTEIEGLGVRNIAVDIYECYKSALEIDGDNTYAIYKLAEFYYEKSMLRESLKYCIRAIKMGDPRAMNLMGEIYFNSNKRQKAAKWYEKAARLGDTRSQYQMGSIYYYGWGVEKDIQKAAKWYEKAAEQGDRHSQLGLAYMYQHGEGVKENRITAAKWYEKAAEQGDSLAQYRLAYMFRMGEGVKENKIVAVKWYEKASEQGYSLAQYDLGNMYYNGEGVKKDFKKALKWYSKAAINGNDKSIFELCNIYRKVFGVDAYERDNEMVAKHADDIAKEIIAKLEEVPSIFDVAQNNIKNIEGEKEGENRE